MQRLCNDMMERYEIDNHRPARINAVQFGMTEALLGTVDRLIDDMNAALPPEKRVGIACVQAGEAGYAKLLSEQDGMYTIVVRGYEKEAAVRREQVVQCVLRAVDPEAEPDALEALAAGPDIELAVVGAGDSALRLAAQFLAARRQAGCGGLHVLYVAPGKRGLDDVSAAATPDDTLYSRGNAFLPALADSLVFRGDAAEAAKLCAEMNYADGMIHLAEPFARLTVHAPDPLPHDFPIGLVPGAVFANDQDWNTAWRLKNHVFDAGLFLMAAAGWLNGCDTLSDCMKHERLRKFVGEAFTRELLPWLVGRLEHSIPREVIEARVIESFERYENPLTRNAILKSAHHLLYRFNHGVWRALREIAGDNFEPPRRLSFALAAAIMLYAGARKNPETGLYEVARGKQAEVILDDPELLARFATLSHDMDPESLAYAALADRELWNGQDLREVDGLLERVTLDIAAMQRDPGFLPEGDA